MKRSSEAGKNCPAGKGFISEKFRDEPAARRIIAKEVDAAENTVRFWQEIYDRAGKLVARHEKFPLDTGHEEV